jgi:hypothetical protein
LHSPMISHFYKFLCVQPVSVVSDIISASDFILSAIVKVGMAESRFDILHRTGSKAAFQAAMLESS